MEKVTKYSSDEVGAAVARYYRGETNGDLLDLLAKGLQRENEGMDRTAQNPSG